MREEPGQQLAHYVLEQEIGRGGMGVVWRAKDTVLGRTVAIKVLPPDLALDGERRHRFLEEARLAASLSHSHVVQVYEFGHQGDLDFIVMEFVDGQPLSKVLHGRPLPYDQVADWGFQMAQGLGQLHRKGLLHRDLKPSNILITGEGELKLADFGLATLLGPADLTARSTASTRTVSGTDSSPIVGTLPYMSPEQLRGEKLDTRSDIFSLGTVLYEMTTGQRPFSESRSTDVQAEILKCQPRPVHELIPKVPLELDRIISKALGKRRASRYQTVDDLAVDLEQLGQVLKSGSAPSYSEILPHGPQTKRALRVGFVAVLALAATIAVVALWMRDRDQGRFAAGATGGGASPDSWGYPSLAAGSARTYFERGSSYLEDAETLSVLDDAIKMFNRAVDMQPDLAAAWALLGEAYWVRFSSYTHDEASRDAATRAVARASQLDAGLPEVHSARAQALIAVGDLEGARRELEAAVAAAPAADKVWAKLGYVHQLKGNYAEALAAFRKAIDLRPGNWRHHERLGYFFDRFSEYNAGAEAFSKATELRPTSAMAWNNLGTAFLKTGRSEKAIGPFSRALEINPEYGSARSNLGTAYYFLKMYDKAAEQYVRATLVEPTVATHWSNLADALKELGERQTKDLYLTAVRLAREGVASEPQNPNAHIALGLYCARAGDAKCAVAEGSFAAGMRPQDAEIAFKLAVIFQIVGQQPEALDWLERAVKLGISKAQLELAPELRDLRQHSRYKRILSLAS